MGDPLSVFTLAPPQEYARRFAICPQAIDATYAIAERLAYAGPQFGIVMPPLLNQNGRDPAQGLREAAYIGTHKRYGAELCAAVVERLEHELRSIVDMQFAAYFLIIQDIVRRSPRICGRGSGAVSLVAYCLGITNVCPLKHNLYFERILNPGRTDPPDIDVDFAWDERDDVLDETFGIMVYLEDVSRTAVALAGFSHADADGLRKIMSKKDQEHQLRDFQKHFSAEPNPAAYPQTRSLRSGT